jgi:hypothetical protein
VKEKISRKELERRRDIAQRAVSVTDFLCIHGFLPDLQTRLMAARVMKYLDKNGLGLADRSFKDYVVLLPKAKIGKKWKVILEPSEEGADEQKRVSTRRKTSRSTRRK